LEDVRPIMNLPAGACFNSGLQITSSIRKMLVSGRSEAPPNPCRRFLVAASLARFSFQPLRRGAQPSMM
jgi:hypothetical protein